jgi:hypothetical protein
VEERKREREVQMMEEWRGRKKMEELGGRNRVQMMDEKLWEELQMKDEKLIHVKPRTRDLQLIPLLCT